MPFFQRAINSDVRSGGRGWRIIISFIGFSQTIIWVKAEFLISIFSHGLKDVAIENLHSIALF